MDTNVAIVVCVAVVAFTSMISSVIKSMNKIAPVITQDAPDLPTNKWDVIDEELIRLHEELSNYCAEDDETEMLMDQISKLNDALAQKE